MSSPSSRYIIGIYGKPGSGKSTFAQFLRDNLPASLVATLSMDGFHLSNEELTRLGRRAWKGAPDTFDIQGFADLLKLIKVGKSDLSFPLFERALEASIPNAGSISARAKLILVEGNYLRLQISGWELLEGLLDESWYLQIPDSLRLERLINRHVEFGKSREQAEAWALGTDEANARLIAATSSRADRIIYLR